MVSGMLKNLHYPINENENIVYPNNTNCSINLVNSILKHYTIKHFHSTLEIMDELLANEYKHIFLIILDGLGNKVIENNLTSDSFMLTKRLMKISAVYPCTTVAATTAIQTGKFPLENGWLGWHQYFATLDKDVTLFTNTEYYSGETCTTINIANDLLPYVEITDLIAKSGIKTSSIFPSFKEGGAEDFDEVVARIKMIAKEKEKSFTYVYWNEPDKTMHDDGCYGENTKQVIQTLDRQLKILSEEISSDSLLIITPDHGMIDVDEIDLNDYPDLLACLKRNPSIEPRCSSFYVKDECHEEFVSIFKREFKDFVLFDKKSLIASKIFGEGLAHPVFSDIVGDYVAMAYGNRMFIHETAYAHHFKAHHAGLTENEMSIPLIVAAKK